MGTFLWEPVESKETVLTIVFCPLPSIVSAVKQLLKTVTVSLSKWQNGWLDEQIHEWIYTYPRNHRQWGDMSESVVKLVHNTHSLNICWLSEYMYFARFTTKVALSLIKAEIYNIPLDM